MECFAWLPGWVLSPQLPADLRGGSAGVPRDSIQACFDCTGLCDFISRDHEVLAVGGVTSYRAASGGVPLEISLTEHILMLKLESHATALQKKESEAFLAAFGKDNYPSFCLNQHHGDGTELSVYSSAAVPSAQIDSRTMDSSILLLAATFAAQTNEYQDKAMQLCVQAAAQFSKAAAKPSCSCDLAKHGLQYDDHGGSATRDRRAAATSDPRPGPCGRALGR